jgi:hypothetical protein
MHGEADSYSFAILHKSVQLLHRTLGQRFQSRLEVPYIVIKNKATLRFTIGSAKTYLASTRAAQPFLRVMGFVTAKVFDWHHNVDICRTTVKQSEGVEHTQ